MMFWSKDPSLLTLLNDEAKLIYDRDELKKRVAEIEEEKERLSKQIELLDDRITLQRRKIGKYLSNHIEIPVDEQ